MNQEERERRRREELEAILSLLGPEDAEKLRRQLELLEERAGLTETRSWQPCVTPRGNSNH